MNCFYRHIRGLVFFFAVLILSAACSTHQPSPQMPSATKSVLSQADREDLLNKLSTLRSEINSIRMLSDLTLPDSTTGRAVIVGLFDQQRLRLEILPPQTGQSIAIVVSQANSALLLLPPQRRAIEGIASAMNLRRVFGAAIEIEELYTIVTGRLVSDLLWNTLEIPGSSFLEDQQFFYITNYNNSLSLKIAKDSGLIHEIERRSVFDRSTIYSASLTYRDLESSSADTPTAIVFELYEPERHNIKLISRNVQVNTEIKEQVFEIAIPANYQRERL